MKCPICHKEMEDDFRRLECKNEECDFGSSLRMGDVALIDATIAAAYQRGQEAMRKDAVRAVAGFPAKTSADIQRDMCIMEAIEALQPEPEQP